MQDFGAAILTGGAILLLYFLVMIIATWRSESHGCE